MKKNKFNSKKGFSLIEVMVATTILMIIVIIVGNIFRHASSAWDTGYSTSEGVAAVRSVLGIVQRELSDAIDGRQFEDWNDPIKIEGNTIDFYRYSDPIKKNSSNPEYEIQKITYTFKDNEVTRKVIKYIRKDNKDKTEVEDSCLYSKSISVGGDSSVDIVFEVKCSKLKPDTLDINENISEDDFWNIPFVWIKASVTKNATVSSVEARSYGPDGQRGTRDDIVAR